MNWQRNNRSELKMLGKTIVITGCTSGIGQYIAVQLAKLGGKIIMLNRDQIQAVEIRKNILKQYPQTEVESYFIDMSSMCEIRRLAKSKEKE